MSSSTQTPEQATVAVKLQQNSAAIERLAEFGSRRNKVNHYVQATVLAIWIALSAPFVALTDINKLFMATDAMNVDKLLVQFGIASFIAFLLAFGAYLAVYVGKIWNCYFTAKRDNIEFAGLISLIFPIFFFVAIQLAGPKYWYVGVAASLAVVGVYKWKRCRRYMKALNDVGLDFSGGKTSKDHVSKVEIQEMLHELNKKIRGEVSLDQWCARYYLAKSFNRNFAFYSCAIFVICISFVAGSQHFYLVDSSKTEITDFRGGIYIGATGIFLLSSVAFFLMKIYGGIELLATKVKEGDYEYFRYLLR